MACAVDMQLAMASVNHRNRQAGYPEVALGIGINTGPMVVGNIGSKKRMKYGVVGSNVNLTAESSPRRWAAISLSQKNSERQRRYRPGGHCHAGQS